MLDMYSMSLRVLDLWLSVLTKQKQNTMAKFFASSIARKISRRSFSSSSEHTMDAEISTSPTVSADANGSDDASCSSSPSVLSIFHEDILLCILGFVADVPLETASGDNGTPCRCMHCSCFQTMTFVSSLLTWWCTSHSTSLFQTAGSHPSRSPIDTRSSLTHTLPLVSKQFHKLCTTHDLFWKAALLRLADRESLGLWEEGLKRFVYDADCRDMRQKLRDVNSGGSSSRNGVRRDKRTRNAAIGASVASEATMDGHEPQCSSSGNDKDSIVSKSETLLDNACKAMERHPPQNHTATSSGIYQCIYRSVLQNHLRFQAPVFCMPWVFFSLHTLHIIWWRIIFSNTSLQLIVFHLFKVPPSD